ncbi:hypothetical protein U2F26_14155 [Micromonospora sp. 4G57]|uniref:Uncharacterized protein n=1 Tax=Micromonospora sicca TaxID=2202420 RepID=A0ABU5JAK2_9ACTN|nr:MULTISPECIES: hypothetical protein [unclassified Micromonospora]MDZ5443867.1 hypothetical protein [Micromonospora sp. 4G57]MDZ5489615.1 hypothetical protein [Micromonospora sp. 4G53]
MATFELARPEALRRVGDEALRDVVWAHTRPEEQVEHIRVRAGPDHISVALFLLAPSQSSVEEVVRDISSRIRALPMFTN